MPKALRPKISVNTHTNKHGLSTHVAAKVKFGWPRLKRQLATLYKMFHQNNVLCFKWNLIWIATVRETDAPITRANVLSLAITSPHSPSLQFGHFFVWNVHIWGKCGS